MDGKKFDDPNNVIGMYELCKAFGVLPSQINQEDERDVEGLILVMNAVNEVQNKDSRRDKRRDLVSKFGTSNKR